MKNIKKGIIVCLSALTLSFGAFALPSYADQPSPQDTTILVPNSARYASFFIDMTDQVKNLLETTGNVLNNVDKDTGRKALVQASSIADLMLHDMSLILPPEQYEQAHYHLMTSIQYIKLSFENTIRYDDSGDFTYLQYSDYDLKMSLIYKDKYNQDLKKFIKG